LDSVFEGWHRLFLRWSIFSPEKRVSGTVR